MTHARAAMRWLVLAVGVTACAMRDAPVTGFAHGDALLIADVADETGDTTLRRGLLAATSIALQQSAHLRLHPRSRVPVIYRLMKIADPETPLTFDLAQEVAERDGVRFVLGLWVTRDGGGYTIGTRLGDTQRQRTVLELTEASPTREGVLVALDRALLRVRRALGEAGRDLDERRVPLPRVATGSLAALRSYAEGSEAWIRGRYPQARESWHRAIELDTGFAMAYSALGGAYYFVRDREQGEKYFGEALARSARLTEWERLRLNQSLMRARGNRDSAVALSRVLAQRFPSVVSWYDYGSELMVQRRGQEALTALDRALAFDSTFVNAWINRATSNSLILRHEDALKDYARAERVDPEVLYRDNLNHEYGGTLVVLGRLGDARQTYGRMSGSPQLANRALGRRSLGYLELWEGHVHEAVNEFQQAVEATHQMQSPLSEGRNRLLLASVYRALNALPEANAEVSRTMTLAAAPSFDPAMLGILAYELKQLDRDRAVDTVAAMIRARAGRENQPHQGARAFADGIAQLARRQPDSALTSFRSATAFPWRIPRLLMTAEAFDALGLRDSVVATLRAVDAEKMFGVEGQADWMRIPLLLGDELMRAGNQAGALRAYEEAITRWGAAPADLPDVVAARARLATLRGVR